MKKRKAQVLFTIIPQEGFGYYILLMVLILIVFGSALAVVFAKHQSRQLFAQLQNLQRQADDLHVEWTQLLLEQGAWATNARVEKVGRERLNMRSPAPQDVVVIR
jgi:cell division protein FtsL